MTESIGWNVTARAFGGPQISANGTLDALGYAKLEVTLPAAGPAQKVALAPGTWASVQMLVIDPSVPSTKLTYNAGGGDVALDGTVFLLGSAVSLLGAGDAALTFTNTGSEDITVDLLVARSA